MSLNVEVVCFHKYLNLLSAKSVLNFFIFICLYSNYYISPSI